MAFPDEPQGVPTPSGQPVSEPLTSAQHVTGDVISAETLSYSDAWSSGGDSGSAVVATPPAPPPRMGGGGAPPKPPDPPDEDDEEGGMARMSFLEHLEELRKRLILAIGGIGVAFILSLLFSDQLWTI